MENTDQCTVGANVNSLYHIPGNIIKFFKKMKTINKDTEGQKQNGYIWPH